MRQIEECPLCGVDLIDNETGYSVAIMIEIPGVYDGGLYMLCPVCDGAYHRWNDERMRAKAQPYIDSHNADRDAGYH